MALESWCNELPDQIDDAVSKLAADTTQAIANDVIDHTPVDITTAASNWQASLNVAPYFELPAIFPGERGSTASESRAEAKAHVMRAIAEKLPGEAIFLSNLTPYIVDLNNGTSKQEPAGMVERAIRIGELFAANYKLEFARG